MTTEPNYDFPPPDWLKWTLVALAVIWIAFCLTSCVTGKKATRYFNSHGFQAAQYCASAFPVKSDSIYIPGIPITRSDTTYLPGDSIPCPEHLPGEPPAVVHCPPSPHIRDTTTLHDTLRITKENTAKISALQQQLTLQTDRADKAENGRARWRKLALWTWGIILVLGGGYLFFKSKISFLTNVIKNIHIK